MKRNFHFGGLARRVGICGAMMTCLLALAVFSGRFAAAETNPSLATVGHIQGSDISVGGAGQDVNAPRAADIASGNVVTVHSGDARLKLAAGGEIYICGPAKFTALQSGDEITLALEFGRLHVDVPAAVKLHVFTPAIVATPLDIKGGTRDLTVGLDLNNALCVVASSGAVRLEQQFTGESMIIPEAGDFSLQGGRLTPVAATGQACRCAAPPQVFPSQPAPEIASNTPPAAPKAAPSEPRAEFSAEVGVLANDSHPLPPEKQEVADVPPPAPEYKIILPPMMFSSSSPSSSVPTAETALLIRQIHVDPDWEFTGHVDAPEFAKAMSRALGESGEPRATAAPAATTPKGGGFWSTLKSIFTLGAAR